MTPRAPGFAPFPRHAVLRVNDLVPPPARPDDVRAALAARGIPEGTRDEPLGAGVRALLAATAAGTVVTLESRPGLRRPRFVVLRHLARELDDLLDSVENDVRRARSPDRTGHNTRREGRDETVTIGIRTEPIGPASTREA